MFQGGFMGYSFEYIKGNQGLMLKEDYPNDEFQNPCKYNSSKKSVEIEGYVYLPSGDEETLKNALPVVGPITVGIDGQQDAFYSYSGGIFYYEGCSKNINHAVLIVGKKMIK